MKAKLLIGVTLALVPSIVWADICETSTKCTDTAALGSFGYCAGSTTSVCYYVTGIGASLLLKRCTACAGNRKLSKILPGTCTNTEAYYTECVCENNCVDTAWTAAGTGYESAVVCGSTCNTATQYRCAKGYYGSPTSNTSGCTRCPASGGTYGTTASAGSTSITSCYLPSGSTFSDSTGSGTVEGNCYWKE